MTAHATDSRRTAIELLRRQYDSIRTAEPGVLAGRVTPLHDLRVAIRRLRNLLKAFRKVLPRPEGRAFEARFRRLSKKLGPARDMDVWMRTLKSAPARRSGQWRAFARRQREMQRQMKQSLPDILLDPPTRALMSDFKRFLDNPAFRAGDISIAVLGAAAIRKSIAQVMERSLPGPALPPRKAHRLRIACRRARYMAEFFAASQGPSATRLARKLKAVQDVLGDIHDCDICLAHLHRAPPGPRGLVRRLQQRRQGHAAGFNKAWKQLGAHLPPFTCQSRAATAN